ncbi:uncharacterized protein FIBRA_02155 [Fibroporia radiculosa]|uniref:F-box domain-containing protein n=1 Tax=Fibroporia radiculosa TaxID=599839 RepID=J4G1D8_9APHY|nr:uncharacterized protein FIBRA_02155 [Fibroporia radiculosa]CCM00128.1 predicted protein [Fibroporia radiculosa]
MFRGPIQAHSYIGALPVELLDIIFKELCYMLPKREPKTQLLKQLASVCRFWSNTLSLNPSFWTSILIIVGKTPTTLADVHMHLSLSGNQLLDIHFLGRGIFHSPADETSQVAKFMILLRPHISRWRSFNARLHHQEALPWPGIDILGRAPKLTRLYLKSREPDDEGCNPIQYLMEGFLIAPSLKELHVDGFIFKNTYLEKPKLLASVTSVSISHFAMYHEPTMSLDGLIKCLHALPRLQSLTLSCVELICREDAEPLMHAFRPKSITFRCIERYVLNEFFRLINARAPRELAFIRCDIPNPSIMRLENVSVLNIQDEWSSESVLMDYLLRFNGRRLRLADSSKFGPRELEALSCEQPSGQWVCPYITQLLIDYCAQCTSANIRRMVEARNTTYAMSGYAQRSDPHFKVHPIQFMAIYNCGVLDPADKEWFNANVIHAIWDDWDGGYGEYD